MMKIFLSIAIVASFTIMNLHAQKTIPPNMLKGIERVTDEFTDEIKFTSKSPSCLTVTSEGEKTSMTLKLSFLVFDSPRPVKKIYLLAGSFKETIEDESKFSISEQPQRYMKTPATGTFGTASYKQAVFDTRMSYVSVFEDDANNYMEFITQTVASGGAKVKFECEGGDYVKDINKKEVENMKKILAIYKYLTE